jgi:hypothetical protein
VIAEKPIQPPKHNALAITSITHVISAQHGPVIQKSRLARSAGVADLSHSRRSGWMLSGSDETEKTEPREDKESENRRRSRSRGIVA